MKSWIGLLCLVVMVVAVGCGDTGGTVVPTAAAPVPTEVPPTATEPGATVSLAASAEEVGVGDTVEVTVSVEGARDLYGVEVHLSFDPAVLEGVGATADAAPEVIDGDLLSVGFTALNAIDNSAGTAEYAVSQMPPAEGVNDDGVLAHLRFKAVAAGTAEIALKEVLLASSEAMAIPVSLAPASVSVVVR